MSKFICYNLKLGKIKDWYHLNIETTQIVNFLNWALVWFENVAKKQTISSWGLCMILPLNSNFNIFKIQGSIFDNWRWVASFMKSLSNDRIFCPRNIMLNS